MEATTLRDRNRKGWPDDKYRIIDRPKRMNTGSSKKMKFCGKVQSILHFFAFQWSITFVFKEVSIEIAADKGG